LESNGSGSQRSSATDSKEKVDVSCAMYLVPECHCNEFFFSVVFKGRRVNTSPYQQRKVPLLGRNEGSEEV
jgi:hypothetical protein